MLAPGSVVWICRGFKPLMHSRPANEDSEQGTFDAHLEHAILHDSAGYLQECTDQLLAGSATTLSPGSSSVHQSRETAFDELLLPADLQFGDGGPLGGQHSPGLEPWALNPYLGDAFLGGARDTSSPSTSQLSSGAVQSNFWDCCSSADIQRQESFSLCRQGSGSVPVLAEPQAASSGAPCLDHNS